MTTPATAAQKYAIVATSQQTRFHQGETRRCAEVSSSACDGLSLTRQVDIKDLNLSIVSSRSSKTGKAQGAAATHELEILAGTELRIKAGSLYGLLGRNGTGKSSKSGWLCWDGQSTL
jgi:ABC-type glutathione transport system ATPase component